MKMHDFSAAMPRRPRLASTLAATIPGTPMARAPPPPGIEVVLQQQRRGQGVHVLLAPSRRPAHLAHGAQRARRRETLVPQLDGTVRAPGDLARQLPGLAGSLAFCAFGCEG